MEYSSEYVAKIVKLIIELVLLVLPILGVAVTDDLRAQAASATAAVGILASFAITIYTMVKQKREQKLTMLGRFTYDTPPQLKR